MSELKAKLRADLTAAMKAKDTDTLATLRMILAAVQTEEVAGDQVKDLSDEDIMKVLTREAKKRAESAQVYSDNGRPELAAKEEAEGEIIARYLPQQLSDDELSAIVAQAIADVESQLGEKPGMRQMGQVMKTANAAIAARADGARVASEVKAQLAS
ncbi:GatB/YqeY domain-containing protein [Hoyosella rhizosphaerae]|uniref:GatB/YqeY domain-containing protein n=1 Tax=Hoyosella rhizosphaerae TaxID=1755582 RepID=A0A916U2Z9_9ACTN|nr:GatB/YqeY domain-containing protein [Hoyosella rhizosphaerae]MBN4926664.1 GatB/YqeY domain-containing protein [Hoyosella rhizosphaerae]GGC57427.1 GatB/YqeY domain-containing protein [Hoyosella rhizosphaerae]